MAGETEFDLESVNAAFRDYVPHNKALGLELLTVSTEPAVAVMRLPWDPRFIGNPETRVLHGGVITTLIDACSGAAVYFKMKAPVPIATLDLRIDYLKPATPERPVQVRAECYKSTRNVAFTRAVAYQDDEADPIATSSATFMLGTRGRSVVPSDVKARP